MIACVLSWIFCQLLSTYADGLDFHFVEESQDVHNAMEVYPILASVTVFFYIFCFS